MAVEFGPREGVGVAHATQAGAGDVQRSAEAAAQDAARQAQLEAAQQLRTMQQEAAQAQRDAEQARRDAEQAVRDAQQQIRDAEQQARDAIREARAEAPPPTWVGEFPGSDQIPEGAIVISIAFFAMCAIIAIGYPIARAFGRRMDRKGAAVGQDPDTRVRLERIEHAVDAIALEVERISEGQRFTSKVLADLRALPEPDPAAALATPMLRARERR